MPVVFYIIIIIISYSSFILTNISCVQIQEIQMRSFNKYVFTYKVIKHVPKHECRKKVNIIENSL